MNKYWRVAIKNDRTTVCPVCGATNRHITGKHCGHVAKVTAKGIVFYLWGWRPEGFTVEK